MHGGAHQIDSHDDQRVVLVVERISEGWDEKNLTVRACLMLVVDDLRKPFPVEDTVDILGLDLIRHEVVTVGVAADILVKKVGKLPGRAVLRIAVIPIRDEVHAVRDS